MASKKKTDSLVRCFEVVDPALHEKGFTIYRVLQKIINVDAPEEDVKQLEVWRRFNDFKKLYKAMFHLHRALHRREEFPPFVQGKLFGRFDDMVLEGRMRSAQDLLNFVGQRHYLVNSKAFNEFFKGAQISDETGRDVLQPERSGDETEETADAMSEDTPSRQPTSKENNKDRTPVGSLDGSRDMEDGSLGGVWQYRQTAEEISLNEDDEDDDNTDFTDGSSLSTSLSTSLNTPLASADLAFFDPLNAPPSLTSNTNENCDDKWMLTSSDLPERTNATVIETSKIDGDNDEDDEELKQLQTEFLSCSMGEEEAQNAFGGKAVSDPTSMAVKESDSSVDLSHRSSPWQQQSVIDQFDPLAEQKSGVECGCGDLTVSPMGSGNHDKIQDLPTVPVSNMPSRHIGVSPDKKTLSSSGGSSPVTSTSASTPTRSPQRRLTAADLQDKADYIFQAANQISLAQQCEANNNYHMAFGYYKKSVGILLTGVQLDENATRREVVRKKTSRYLLKAEELYHLYLAEKDRAQQNRWDGNVQEILSYQTDQTSPVKGLDPRTAFLQGHVSELRNFKVIGIVDRVILVIDVISETTYVIKVLHKSCMSTKDRKKTNIIVSLCPFMVRLHKFYETDSALYLLLEYASGGKLWTYISGYLQQQQEPDVENMTQRDNPYRTTAESDDSPGADQADSDVSNRTNGVVSMGVDAQSDKGKSSTAGNVTPPSVDSAERRQKPQSSLSKLNCHREARFSLSSDDALSPSPTVIPHSGEGTPALPQHHAHPGFADVFVHQKPSLEQFSINSFDSDSGPGSRFESTASDYNIESIPEVPFEVSPSHLTPTQCFPGAEQSLTSGDVFNINAEVISSAADVIKETVDKLNDHAFSQSELASHSTPVKLSNVGDESVASSADDGDQGSVSLQDEESIYDRFKGGDSEPSIGSSPLAPSPIADIPSESDSASTNVTSVIEQPLSPVFRQPSVERSLESPTKPRRRTLSSVFCELDLADENVNGAGESSQTVRLPEVCVRQWVAEIITALARLHNLGVICVDLHPDNILLGERGHIMLTHFSQWSAVDAPINQRAIDKMYAAPEVCGVGLMTPSCDWWSLGVLLYELLTGKTFVSCHPSGVTSHTQLVIPNTLSSEAQAILTDFLRYEPGERLGAGIGGADDIKLHPFFTGVDWDCLQ